MGEASKRPDFIIAIARSFNTSVTYKCTQVAWGLRDLLRTELADPHMRKPLYFDGDPDLFTRTKALFARTSRLQVRYPTPNVEHHALQRDEDREPPAWTPWTFLKRTA